MTPRTTRYAFGIILAGILLLCLLAIPGTRAGLTVNADGVSSEGNGHGKGASDSPVDDNSTQDAYEDGNTDAWRLNLRLNLTRILEMAEKETPILRHRDILSRESGSGKIVDDAPETSDHPSGGFRPIYGGMVNISWLVRIQILSEQGSPVAGATIWLIDGLGGVVCEVKTDENGMTPPMALLEARISEAGTLNMNPYTVVVDGGGGAQEFPMRVESDGTVIFVLEIPMADEPFGAVAYMAAAFATIMSCLVTPLSFERSRYALLIPIIPLYSKLRKEDILGQSTRGLILDYIMTHPGEHFGAIKKALYLSNGNAVYHLRFLEKQGLIKSRLSGIYRRFYSRDYILPPDNGEACLAE